MLGKFAGGDGSQGNPYLIEDAFDLDAVRNNLTASYKLIRDIDLNVRPFNEGWKPIGQGISNGFCGDTFDGNGHIVKNMYINNYNSNNGLFSEINNSNIKNLGILNGQIINGEYKTALISGEIENTNVINCFGTGVVNSTGSYVGGFIGLISENCVIKNCYTICNVTGKDFVGGFIGGRYRNSFKISNCYCVNNITILDKNNYNNAGSFASSYSGDSSYPTCSNIYYDKDICNYYNENLAQGKTTSEMKTPFTYIDWDKEKTDDGKPVWILKEDQYPKLWFEKESKFLLKQDDKYYSIKNKFYKNNQYESLDCQNLSEDIFKKYGFDDISLLTTDTEIKNESFKPKDKLKQIGSGQFEIFMKEIKDI